MGTVDKQKGQSMNRQPESQRIAEQLSSCYVALRRVNELIRDKRERNDMEGLGALMGEQKNLLQHILHLREAGLQGALVQEFAEESKRLPSEIEDLQAQVDELKRAMVDEVSADAVDFFSKLFCLGTKFGRDGAAIVLPLEFRELLTQGMRASQKTEFCRIERQIMTKRQQIISGVGVWPTIEASRLNMGAMAAALEIGFDVDKDFFGPLYEDVT
jgi:hypothetical protein